MDLLTHLSLGACIGEIALSKRLGKKALLLGAAAQSFPDIDVLASLWASPAENLLIHRGLTHSLLFGIVAAALLTLGTRKVWRAVYLPFLPLFVFICLQLWLHDVLDTCNAYGTGLFEPFSHRRFSINLLFVGDPFFSVSIITAAIALVVLKKESLLRKKWLLTGLLPALAYLSYAMYNKVQVQEQAKTELATEGIRYESMITTPTPFNTWLWYIVAATDSGYVTGYYAVADSQPVTFTFHPQNKQLLQKVDEQMNIKALLDFAKGYYTLGYAGDTLVFNVLRFGQVHGWQNPQAPFAFRYILDPAYDNTLVMQRGRVKGWNRHSIAAMYRRIKGN